MNSTLPTLRRVPAPAVLLAAALVAIALPAAAAGPLATATIYAGGVDFLPMVAHDGGTLTVTGPTMTYQRSFGAGEQPSVDLFDPEGQLLPDGVYKYRLQLTPSRWDARELRRAASQNGRVDPDAWPAVYGSFAIHNGLVADPSLAEARRAHPATRTQSALPADLAGAAHADRVGDDGDEAIAAGRGPVAGPAPAAAPAGRTVLSRTDAGAAQAPVTRAPNDDPPPAHRPFPTEGRNGRVQ